MCNIYCSCIFSKNDVKINMKRPYFIAHSGIYKNKMKMFTCHIVLTIAQRL